MNDKKEREQVQCYLTRTTAEKKQMIEENIKRSAMFGGEL